MSLKTTQKTDSHLSADLGLVTALSLVVGMVLGAGAFMKPPAVLAVTGDTNLALAAWAVGGLLSMAGGLSLCELGVLFPRTGGVFVYLEELYGAKVAFLFGWMLSIIFGPALVGALTGYFSSVFCLLFDVSTQYAPVVGAGALGFIAFVNSINVRASGYLQTTATFCKLLPVLLLITFGLLKGNGQVALFSSAASGVAATAPFSVAVLATLFAYDGWAQVASVAGEMKNPGKILPRAIIGGLTFLLIVYLSINTAFFKIFGVEEMIALGHDASAVAAQQMFGVFGGNLIAVGIMVSILGGLNGYIMTISRNIYVMGERGLVLGSGFLRKIDADSKAPVNAMIVLVFFSFIYYRMLDADKLSDIAMFSIWIFYLLTFLGVFIARKKFPDAPRSYKVPLYPITPLIASAGAIYVIYGMLSAHFWNGIISIVLTLSGLPMYYYLKNKNRASSFLEKWKTCYIVGASVICILGLLTVSTRFIDTREELRVAVDPAFAPFAYEENSGRMAGFDIELMNKLADKVGVKVTYQVTPFNNIFNTMRNGYADLAISSLTITPERKEDVIFTNPYIEKSGFGLLVKRESNLHNIQDLKGKTVGVQRGSTSELFVQRYHNFKVQFFNSNIDMSTAFNQGQIDAIIFDRLILEHFMAKGIIEDGAIVEMLNQEDYAIALTKKYKSIGDKMNEALEEMKKNGELDALYQKWIEG